MPDIKATIVITALAIVEALQIVAMIAHVYTFIPIKWNAPIPAGLEPERESFFYIVFLVTSFLLSAGLAIFLYKPLQAQSFRRRCIKFLCVESFWLLLMLFAFFKWVTYTYPFYNILPLENSRWVLPFFYGVIACSLLSKIFWVEIDRATGKIAAQLNAFVFPEKYHIAAYAVVILGIFILLYPNTKVTVSIISQWSNFTQWKDFGFTNFLLNRGFNPEHIVMILLFLNVIILGTIFIVTHRLLKSFWLSTLVIILIIKMTFFHYGMAAVCWNYPASTLINPSMDLNFFKDPNNEPMFTSLRVRQFFSFFMGYAIIIFYVFSLLSAWGKNKVMVILSIIGLMMYTRYIGRADVFAYGAVCWPAVILMAFWLQQLTKTFFKSNERIIYAAFVLVAVFMLLTNRVFLTYPHFWGPYGQ